MIIEIQPKDYNVVKKFAEKDIARNYFILLGLSGKKQVYHKIFGQYEDGNIKALLFLRKSKTLQFFAPGEFDEDGFVDLISSLEYHGLIGPRSYCDDFLDRGIFSSSSEGAYISKMNKDYIIEPYEKHPNIRDIRIEDLDEIVELYIRSFTSFSSKEVMEEKLHNNRGRGVCIEEKGKIISIAQTDFETKDGAVIVGVATIEDNRCKGLATQCLQVLCSSLLKEGKDLYLQYDNLEAGKIYERLGFKIMDQVFHYKK